MMYICFFNQTAESVLQYIKKKDENEKPCRVDIQFLNYKHLLLSPD